MFKKFLRTFILLVFLIGTAACSTTGSSTGLGPKVDKPEAGKATVTGRVISLVTQKPIQGITVWLAEVVRQNGEGAYVLDVSFSPANPTDEQGYFVIANADAMEYVIVVGDPYTQYVVIPDPDKKPKVWNALADQILDVGDLVVDLSKSPTSP